MLIGAEKAPWHYILLNGGWDQSSASCRTVGGRATPEARRARLAAGRGGERRRKRLPSCSTSVSVNESRSARMASQDPVSAASPPAAGLPRLAMRSHLRRGIIPVEDTPLWPIEKALGRKVSGEYTVPV